MTQGSNAKSCVPSFDYDLVIVGAGLAGGLLALWLKDHHPGVSVLLLEQSESSASVPARTWSFHQDDVSGVREWIKSLPGLRSWDGYQVSFPDLGTRTFDTTYFSWSSEALMGALTQKKIQMEWNARVHDVAEHRIQLGDGRVFTAPIVLDSRGASGLASSSPGAFQKFLGIEVELLEPHGVNLPCLMDANCEQGNDFRFFYVLPLSPTRLLVEDTRYSLSPEIDAQFFSSEIHRYIGSKGWLVQSIKRTEQGVLSVPFGSNDLMLQTSSSLCLGVRAGLFHPVTAYSVGWVSRLLKGLAQGYPTTEKDWRDLLGRLQKDHNQTARFYHFLNRMLFFAVKSSERYRVLECFHRLPASVIRRFYASETTFLDRVRILATRPPLSIKLCIANRHQITLTQEASTR